MGSRRLTGTHPLTDIREIDRRLDAVEFLADFTVLRLWLCSQLARCADIERIAGPDSLREPPVRAIS